MSQPPFSPEGNYPGAQQPGWNHHPGAQGPQMYPVPSSPFEPWVGKVQLCFWLSLFFNFLVPLIFYLVADPREPRHVRQSYANALNFQLMYLIAVIGLFWFVPFNIVLYLVLIVFMIIGAATSGDRVRAGVPADYVFNLPMVTAR